MIVNDLITLPFKSLVFTLIRETVPSKSFHICYTEREGMTVHFFHFVTKTGESEELVPLIKSCPRYWRAQSCHPYSREALQTEDKCSSRKPLSSSIFFCCSIYLPNKAVSESRERQQLFTVMPILMERNSLRNKFLHRHQLSQEVLLAVIYFSWQTNPF